MGGIGGEDSAETSAHYSSRSALRAAGALSHISRPTRQPLFTYRVAALRNMVHAAAENTSTLATMTGEAPISTP
jgi:hypothetical protein